MEHKATATALRDFVGQDAIRGGHQCWACNIPERQELDAFHRENVAAGKRTPFSVLGRWLVSQGHDDKAAATMGNRLSDHFRKGHANV